MINFDDMYISCKCLVKQLLFEKATLTVFDRRYFTAFSLALPWLRPSASELHLCAGCQHFCLHPQLQLPFLLLFSVNFLASRSQQTFLHTYADTFIHSCEIAPIDTPLSFQSSHVWLSMPCWVMSAHSVTESVEGSRRALCVLKHCTHIYLVEYKQFSSLVPV